MPTEVTKPLPYASFRRGKRERIVSVGITSRREPSVSGFYPRLIYGRSLLPSYQGDRLRHRELRKTEKERLHPQELSIQGNPSSPYSLYVYSIAPTITKTTLRKNNCVRVSRGIEEDILRINEPTITPTPKFLKVSPKKRFNFLKFFTPTILSEVRDV